MRYFSPFLLILILLTACEKNENQPRIGIVTVDSIFVNNIYVNNNGLVRDIDFERTKIRIRFDKAVDTARFDKSKVFFTGERDTFYSHFFRNDARELIIFPSTPFSPLSGYRLIFSQGPNLGGTVMDQYTFLLRTRLDSTFKFPLIPDEELLTLVQQHTFRYFWDYAHPVSGLVRERLGSGELVTTGGSGFGLMTIITGIERGFITRQEGFEHLNKIVNFLLRPETDRYHGAFPHWLNGTTGKTIPFSARDNGGDIVETAFLMQGLITVKEYFRNGTPEEVTLCDSIQKLWEGVNWDWYRRNESNFLYWHWSPEYEWDMNLPVRGWNEALIVYVLAASSPTFPIPKEVYDLGWARNGNYPMINGKTFANIRLPLGEDWGGPLFFAHYSFLGLDPRNLSDTYADYMEQNNAHALINQAYCIANPQNHSGYSKDCWGLTASDIQGGYTASSPTNDRGVIAPTAALASIPYTPDASMDALRFFYYILGDKIWGEFGFRDAFSLTDLWFADSYLAIDQGPVVIMIENYRSGLLWDLFMDNPDVKRGLDNLGFSY